MFTCLENSLSLQFSSVQLLNRVQLFATPWTAAHQASLSVEFSRQEYWSGLPFPSPSRAWELQLLSLRTAVTEAFTPRAHALQEKPLQ